MKVNAPIVLAAFVVGCVIVVAMAVWPSHDLDTYEQVATTSEPTSTTEWVETQPGLGHRFDEYRAGVEAARAARVKRKPTVRVMRGEWPWDAVKDCETPGLGWDANTGNGFEGGLQFMNSTWLGYGGGAFAQHAYQATRGQQITIAQRVLADQGWRAWPTCSRKLGLR